MAPAYNSPHNTPRNNTGRNKRTLRDRTRISKGLKAPAEVKIPDVTIKAPKSKVARISKSKVDINTNYIYPI